LIAAIGLFGFGSEDGASKTGRLTPGLTYAFKISDRLQKHDLNITDLYTHTRMIYHSSSSSYTSQSDSNSVEGLDNGRSYYPWVPKSISDELRAAKVKIELLTQQNTALKAKVAELSSKVEENSPVDTENRATQTCIQPDEPEEACDSELKLVEAKEPCDKAVPKKVKKRSWLSKFVKSKKQCLKKLAVSRRCGDSACGSKDNNFRKLSNNTTVSTSAQSDRDSLHDTNEASKQRNTDKPSRIEKPHCFFCPKLGAFQAPHWTSECHLLNAGESSFEEFSNFLERRNKRFHTKMNDNLRSYHAKLVYFAKRA